MAEFLFNSSMSYKQADGNGNIYTQRLLPTILHLVQDLVTVLRWLGRECFCLEVLQMIVKIQEVTYQGNLYFLDM